MEKFIGAEAVVTVEEDRVIKKRHPKKYRHRDIDVPLRKDRTEREKKILEEAGRVNVKCPSVEKVDDHTLELEKIDGKPLKNVLEENIHEMKTLGRYVARLHKKEIIHGDLTTSNAVMSDELYLIDFGLSYRSHRIEDMAVDIHLLKQVLRSSHPDISDKAWNRFEEGYSEFKDSEEVLERLEEVEARGRYK